MTHTLTQLPPLEILQDRLGVTFRAPSLLERALTHRSASSEYGVPSNERLEFLGDSVLGMVVAEKLFTTFPKYTEGEMAKSKAYIVSEPALADAARALGIDEFLRLSPSEEASGGRARRSILADAFEAVVAAIYLDCGMAAAQRIVHGCLLFAIRDVAADAHRCDYKSALQELTQARRHLLPIYQIVSEEGFEHDKTFVAQALLGDSPIGEGTGQTKKEAEQAAAKCALYRLEQRAAPAPRENKIGDDQASGEPCDE